MAPISIPRSYFGRLDKPLVSATLVGFCDTSVRAYTAVVYLMLKTDADVAVNFVAANTRVAPLQPQTIPRLELLSAFLLSYLVVSVANGLRPTLPQLHIQCYTDSQVALYWICGTSREWKPFVQNRVNEIRRNVHRKAWSHCPGKSNPADLPPRGLASLEFKVSQLWQRGPEWLDACFTPPTEPQPVAMPEECSTELKASALRSLNLVATESKGSIGDLIYCEDFSTLSRLLRVTVQVLRAVQQFKSSKSSNHPTTVTSGKLANAKLLWIVCAQKQLVDDKDFKSQQWQFNLFLDDKGVWRCRRLTNSDVPYATKHPILLLRTHPLTSLILRQAHDRVCHNGVKETLTETRRRFWIPRGRSLTRYMIHRCVLCQRYEGAPLKTPPPPPPLPTFRVKDDPAFTYNGVDFAGPLSIHGNSASNKVWICLFMCLVTRAVHLDLVSDQSTPNIHSMSQEIRSTKRTTSQIPFQTMVKCSRQQPDISKRFSRMELSRNSSLD